MARRREVEVPLKGRVVVETGSRLHAGFYYAGGEWGVRWAGAGFYISEPRVVVEAWECRYTIVRGPYTFAHELLDRLGIDRVCIDFKEHIPQHVGLGSTTQASLACAHAAILLKQGYYPDPIKLAAKLGLGRVSGVGTLAYKYGGFVADAGVPSPEGPRLLLRHEIPGDWRFIVLIPKLPRGLSGRAEERVLSAMGPPSERASRLMARGFLRLASAVARGDLAEALRGLQEMQTGTGMYFSEAQGGVYREDLAEIVKEALKRGIRLAQSSWGPTLYTIAPTGYVGEYSRVLRGIAWELDIEAELLVVKPRNEGSKTRWVKEVDRVSGLLL